jgi:hypothetical protein
MLKVNDKVKVHMYDTCNREIKTQNYGTVFTVREVNGKLGIDWNTEKSPYTCKGEVFTPFEAFSHLVIFENVENEKKYHWSNVENGIAELEV